MHFFQTFTSVFIRSGTQVAACAVAIPGLGPVGDILANIIALCESVPQNKDAARRLALKCHHLCTALQQYEKRSIPDQMVQNRDNVFKCLKKVEDTMQKWSEKTWFQMLVHQGDFDVKFNDCCTEISDCLGLFSTTSQMEMLAGQNDAQKWRMHMKESHDANHKAIVKEFSNVNFMQQVMQSNLTENRNDTKAILTMMQRGLAEHQIVSEEERSRMAKNLYDLLRLSDQLPPNCQLDSGEVEWSGDTPTMGSPNVEMHKGRFLHSEDVRIKVIRSIDLKDEKNVERIRREVELWARIYEKDKGKHIIPFYGFYTPDGLRLHLVSPWMNKGNALANVQNFDRLIDYKKLILGIAEGIKVLHSMTPPIVHGNLRAEKVLIGNDGQPLITDFALAKLEGNSVTQFTGTADGFRWCAPEMWEKHGTVSPQGDVYSFAMTVLELFTHAMPYADTDNLPQVVMRKMDKDGLPGRPQDSRVFERGLSDGMWALLCLCWSRNPQHRPSIDDVVIQLRSLPRQDTLASA